MQQKFSTKQTRKDVENQVAVVRQAGTESKRAILEIDPDAEAAAAISGIKKGIEIPLVADIHFDYRLALAALQAGADGLRLNPGNIGGRDRVAKVVAVAKERGLPIRIGVNAGSLEKDLLKVADPYGPAVPAPRQARAIWAPGQALGLGSKWGKIANKGSVLLPQHNATIQPGGGNVFSLGMKLSLTGSVTCPQPVVTLTR